MMPRSRWYSIPIAALLVAACSDHPELPGRGAAPSEPGFATSIDTAGAPLLRAAPHAEVIRDRYIVVFRDDVGNAPELSARLVAAHGGKLHYTYQYAIKGFAATLPARAVEGLRHNPHVAYIQPDQAARLNASTQIEAPWGLDRIDQRRGRDGTFTYQYDGSQVRVYVIDTGINRNHPEFEGRAKFGFDACFNGQCNVLDGNGHGTMVAGIIGARTYGVAKGTNLVSVRVMSNTPLPGDTIIGNASSIMEGVDWVTGQKYSNPAVRMVANVSAGVAADVSLDAAVRRSIAAGVTYVVSAGNSNDNACAYSPARVVEAITVGSIDQSDRIYASSSFGPCVDVYAPGRSIPTTTKYGGTASVTGTSFAAPHVTGFAAMYLHANAGSSPADIHSAVIAWATRDSIGNLDPSSHNRILYTRFEPVVTEVTVDWLMPSHLAGGPPNTLTAAGFARNGTGGVKMEWRDISVNYNGPWIPVAGEPIPGAGGAWSNTLPSSNYCHDYHVRATYSGVVSRTYTYRGRALGYCNETARVIWMQPQATAGWGTPGALVVSGEAKGAPSGTKVTMWYRNETTGSAGYWTMASYSAPTDANGIWYSEIPNANYSHRYEAYVRYDVITSSACTYTGGNSITWC